MLLRERFIVNFTVVSLLCGAGGMDFGFTEAGYKILLGIDYNSDSCRTHMNWSSANILNMNILDVELHEIPNSDIILGSLTAMPLSRGNMVKYIENNRQDNNLKILQIIKSTKPKAFVLEGLKGFLRNRNNDLDVIALLGEYGYRVDSIILNSKDYMIPQNREILVIVGVRNDLEGNFEFPKKENEMIKLKSVFKEFDKDNFEDRMKFNLRSIEKPGLSIWNNRYKKLELDNLAPSIRGYRLIREDLLNDNKDYCYSISWREAALIQSFPVEFEFLGSLSAKFRQIEESFPPKLARLIAQELELVLKQNMTSNDKNNNIKRSRKFTIPEHLIVGENDGIKKSISIKKQAKSVIINGNSSTYSKKNTLVEPTVSSNNDGDNKINRVLNETVMLDNYPKDVSYLLKSLDSVNPGPAEASKYHRIIFECLSFIFNGSLKRGRIEAEINEGRKRIDILFDNYDEKGFFAHIRDRHNIFCPKIFIECKNYTNDDISNPEVDQLIGRLSNLAGKLGVLICRKVFDEKSLLKRCKDAISQSNSYILFLNDEDIIKLMKLKDIADEEGIMELLSIKWDQLIM